MTQSKIAPQPADAAASAAEGLGDAITQALPISDVAFGGGVLVLVVFFHAFWIRVLTTSYLTRIQRLRNRGSAWHADLLFARVVVSLLALHLSEVLLWSAALAWSGIIPNMERAAYFAANCYTALGEPFSLSHDWRIVPPIIAMSGIFTFAFTASFFVNFVARYNELRAAILRARH